MGVLPECIYVYHVCAWFLGRSEEGIKFPRTNWSYRLDVSHHAGARSQMRVLWSGQIS